MANNNDIARAALIKKMGSITSAEHHPLLAGLPHSIAYEEAKHNHPLRKGTAFTVKLYEPFVLAECLYNAENGEAAAKIASWITPSGEQVNIPFSLILCGKSEDGPFTALEAHIADKTDLLIRVTAKRVWASNITYGDDQAAPIISHTNDFGSMSLPELTMFALALLYHLHKTEPSGTANSISQAGNRISQAWINGNWKTDTDIPADTLDDMYYLDAIVSALENSSIEVGDSASATITGGSMKRVHYPKSIPNKYLKSLVRYFTGSTICENPSDTWTPSYVKSDGKKAALKTFVVKTMGDAKKFYGDIFSDHQWTEEELRMIPEFPDDMPVSDEIIQLANKFYRSRTSTNPACIGMYRGSTGVGKSTASRMLACMFHQPYIAQTCFTTMEQMDFFAQIVPVTKMGGFGLGTESAATNDNSSENSGSAAPQLSPVMKESVDYLLSLSPEDRKQALDEKRFIETASTNPIVAAKSIFGDSYSRNLTFTQLIRAFVKVHSYMENELLRKENEKLRAASGSEPEFVTVPAPYAVAASRGWFCEIQECSRIMQPGVLVGLNEFNQYCGSYQLVDGTVIHRHRDALCLFTDNIGYDSCRNIDPSVLRRMAFIKDAHELTKKQLFERVRFNTGIDDEILNLCYKYFECVKEYCSENEITDGSCSPVEFEWFCRCVDSDGMETASGYNLDDCLISKATSDPANQRDIRSACISTIS